MIELTEGEKKASDAILAAMASIQDMDGRKLSANEHELFAAIHILQGFVKQHILHRQCPEKFSSWWCFTTPHFTIPSYVTIPHDQVQITNPHEPLPFGQPSIDEEPNDFG